MKTSLNHRYTARAHMGRIAVVAYDIFGTARRSEAAAIEVINFLQLVNRC